MATTGQIEKNYQPGLDGLSVYPRGFYHFPGRLGRDDQALMIEQARVLAREAPFVAPVTSYGVEYRLKVTSWGEYGWFEDQHGGRRYLTRHPKNGRAWPPIPPDVMRVMKAAARDAGCPDFEPDTVLVNFYPGDDQKPGRLGLHRDTTEKNQVEPIVTLSLGASAVFLLGGPEYDDPPDEIALDGGDVIVMAPPSRMFYHAVDRLLATAPATAVQLPKGGRLSFTARRNI